MIELRNVDKYYKSRFQRTFILKDVNFSVKEGELSVLWGRAVPGNQPC